MLIVGINAYHGDASAAAIVDGMLVAAAEEERFNRIKHAAGFPVEALKYVVSAAGASPRDIDILAVARDPWARIMRKAWHTRRGPQRGVRIHRAVLQPPAPTFGPRLPVP